MPARFYPPKCHPGETQTYLGSAVVEGGWHDFYEVISVAHVIVGVSGNREARHDEFFDEPAAGNCTLAYDIRIRRALLKEIQNQNLP